MPRRGNHGAATVRQTAAELGCSTATVCRDERSALLRITFALEVLAEELDELPFDSPLLAVLRRVAYRCYLERLAACPPGVLPEGEPPVCP